MSIARRPPQLTTIDQNFPEAVVSLGPYEGALRRLILVAKHSEREDLTSFLTQAGINLGKACGLAAVPDDHYREVWVVPAPSSWRRRLHGRSVTVPLSQAVARGIAQSLNSLGIYTIEVSVVDAVRLRVGARSQSGRGGQERRRGRHATMRARVTPPRSAAVVLVDDVVTTGATLTELARCLGRAQIAVCLSTV
ncbi:competence protein ComF [Schaalia vaccimaxillae]|uniref:competence protein ComF n=1 Tax=Schaalia vaccimaxillae TaxID=183916 RepID=UPI001FB12EDA|nr:competence protein ComF [Schaalia vaccimaxillae]